VNPLRRPTRFGLWRGGRFAPRSARSLYNLFLIPGNVALVLLFVVPLVLVILFSFGTVDIVGRPHFGTTLTNFRAVLQSYYVPVFVRTVLFALATTVLSLVLGYPMAYFAARFAGRWGPVIIAAIILTWLVDYLVRIYAWTAILAQNGVFNHILSFFSLGPVTLLGTNTAVVIGLVYGYFPLMVLPVYASLTDLRPDLIEAGKDLYGSPLQTFLHVTLPATFPGVLGGVLLTFLPALGDFATAQFLGGANSTMIGNLISEQFTDTGAPTFGSALTVLLLVVLLIGIGLAARLGRGALSRAVTGSAL